MFEANSNTVLAASSRRRGCPSALAF